MILEVLAWLCFYQQQGSDNSLHWFQCNEVRFKAGELAFSSVQNGERALGKKMKVFVLQRQEQSFHWHTDSSDGRTAVNAKSVLNKRKKSLWGKKLCIHTFNRGKSFATLIEKRSKPFFCSGNHIHHLYQIKTMKKKAITTHLPYSSPINFLLNISSSFPK